MGYARPAEPKFTTARIEDIVNRVLNVLGDRVSTKSIAITTEFADNLPEIKVDPLQIEQVLMNLLINACHAMPAGGHITINCRTRGNHVETNVSDTGTGIDPKDLQKIFDPFFTTKKEGEGTGLGLAICNSIVEHNGGALRVRSKPGQGSTFTLLLPVDKGQRLRALKGKVRRRSRKEQPTTPQPRILLIDDEKLLNEMMQEALRSAGYQVDAAFDGEEGIQKLRSHPYDLILLDIRMPRKDGLEVLQFVRDEFPNIKVVIITGLANKKEIAETVKMGAFACLKKPFPIDKVLEIIRRALISGRTTL